MMPSPLLTIFFDFSRMPRRKVEKKITCFHLDKGDMMRYNIT